MSTLTVVSAIEEFRKAVINDILHEVAEETLQERLISLTKENANRILESVDPGMSHQ